MSRGVYRRVMREPKKHAIDVEALRLALLAIKRDILDAEPMAALDRIDRLLDKLEGLKRVPPPGGVGTLKAIRLQARSDRFARVSTEFHFRLGRIQLIANKAPGVNLADKPSVGLVAAAVAVAPRRNRQGIPPEVA